MQTILYRRKAVQDLFRKRWRGAEDDSETSVKTLFRRVQSYGEDEEQDDWQLGKDIDRAKHGVLAQLRIFSLHSQHAQRIQLINHQRRLESEDGRVEINIWGSVLEGKVKWIKCRSFQKFLPDDLRGYVQIHPEEAQSLHGPACIQYACQGFRRKPKGSFSSWTQQEDREQRENQGLRGRIELLVKELYHHWVVIPISILF